MPDFDFSQLLQGMSPDPSAAPGGPDPSAPQIPALTQPPPSGQPPQPGGFDINQVTQQLQSLLGSSPGEDQMQKILNYTPEQRARKRLQQWFGMEDTYDPTTGDVNGQRIGNKWKFGLGLLREAIQGNNAWRHDQPFTDARTRAQEQGLKEYQAETGPMVREMDMQRKIRQATAADLLNAIKSQNQYQVGMAGVGARNTSAQARMMDALTRMSNAKTTQEKNSAQADLAAAQADWIREAKTPLTQAQTAKTKAELPLAGLPKNPSEVAALVAQEPDPQKRQQLLDTYKDILTAGKMVYSDESNAQGQTRFNRQSGNLEDWRPDQNAWVPRTGPQAQPNAPTPAPNPPTQPINVINPARDTAKIPTDPLKIAGMDQRMTPQEAARINPATYWNGRSPRPLLGNIQNVPAGHNYTNDAVLTYPAMGKAGVGATADRATEGAFQVYDKVKALNKMIDELRPEQVGNLKGVVTDIMTNLSDADPNAAKLKKALPVMYNAHFSAMGSRPGPQLDKVAQVKFTQNKEAMKAELEPYLETAVSNLRDHADVTKQKFAQYYPDYNEIRHVFHRELEQGANPDHSNDADAILKRLRGK